MAIIKLKDRPHKTAVKFVNATLPNTKKPYNLKAVLQTELDIDGIAAKADVYDMATSPQVIIEGFNAACELIYYLLGDGYKIKTSLCTARMRFPGEYDGHETALAEGVYPEVRMQTSHTLRKYIAERVEPIFDGILDSEGFIGSVVDEETGLIDEVATIGGILSIRGIGLKIESDEIHKDQVGVFFMGESTPDVQVRPTAISVNEPKLLKVIVPSSMVSGQKYTLKIVTMSGTRSSGYLLKDPRVVTSSISLAATSLVP